MDILVYRRLSPLFSSSLTDPSPSFACFACLQRAQQRTRRWTAQRTIGSEACVFALRASTTECESSLGPTCHSGPLSSEPVPPSSKQTWKIGSMRTSRNYEWDFRIYILEFQFWRRAGEGFKRSPQEELYACRPTAASMAHVARAATEPVVSSGPPHVAHGALPRSRGAVRSPTK